MSQYVSFLAIGILLVFLKPFIKRMIEFIWALIKRLFITISTIFPSIIKIVLWIFLVFIQIRSFFGYLMSDLPKIMITKSKIALLITLILTGLFYLFLWDITNRPSSSLDEDFFKSFYKTFGFNTYDDYITLSLVGSGTKALYYLLTAVLTFFYFTYREQRAAAISNISSNVSSLFIFIIFIVLAIPYGTQLNSILSYHINRTSSLNNGNITLQFSTDNIIHFFVWGILFLISLFSGLWTMIQFMRNLNIRNMIGNMIKQVENHFIALRFSFFSFERKVIYNNLFLSIESLHQLMSIAVDKNMDEAFSSNYDKWTLLLADVRQSPRLNHLDSTVMNEYLLKRDGEEFERLFNSILKNHNALIMNLIKNNKIGDALKCIEVFFQMNPSEVKLRFIFLNALQELAVLIYPIESIGIKPILDLLERLASDDIGQDQNGINVIYKSLIIKSIEKNDVKMLSSISYSMSKSLENISQIEKKMLNSNLKMLTISTQFKVQDPADIEQIKLCVIFILLQGALKSLELSHYSCAGFLTKFLVTNSISSIMNTAFYSFVHHNGENNPYLKQREQIHKFNQSFDFNHKTQEYCLKKLSILLFGQQKFVSENKISIGEQPNNFISITHVNCQYIDYIFGKIELAKSKYGLIFLHDTEGFMKSLKNEVLVNGSNTHGVINNQTTSKRKMVK